MLKYSLLISCIIGSVYFAFAQEASQIIPPSPNVASLDKYGNIPVSAYTGTPNISIPLYEVVSGDIKVPISISYHASGIKVGEEASRVGLGWALQAGGVISRTIYGEDDFDGRYFDTTIQDYPDNHLNPHYIISFLQSGCVLKYSTHGSIDLTNYLRLDKNYDYQPDQYYFNFNGHSGKFILKRNKEVVLASQEKISIKMIGNDHTKWEIITADGFKYLFEEHEAYSDYSGSGAPQINKISAWYLTKIISPRNKHVEFKYEKRSNNHIRTVGSYTESSSITTLSKQCPNTPCKPGTYTGSISPGKDYSLVLLKAIEFDNGVVSFAYEERDDIQGDERLKNIVIEKVNKQGVKSLVKRINFGYEYFESPDDIDYNPDVPLQYLTKRLKLISVQEEGGDGGNKNPYKFSYYEGGLYDQLPSKSSFARDHWGYYNGKKLNTSLIPTFVPLQTPHPLINALGGMGPNRNSDPLYSKAFMLKEIEYPMKGKTIFEYESHTFDVVESRSRDKTIFANTPTIVETEKRLLYSGTNKGIIYESELDLTDLFVDPFGGKSSQVKLVAGFRFNANCSQINIGTNQVYFELYNSDGNRISRVDVGELIACSEQNQELCAYCPPNTPVSEYKNTYLLSPGKYTWKAFASGNNTNLMSISANFIYHKEVGTESADSPISFDYAGGVRIKRIIDIEPITREQSVKKFMYHYEENKNNKGIKEYSYGKRMAAPRYTFVTVDYMEGIKPFQETCCYTIIRTSDSSIPLFGSAAGSVVGYDKVEVYLGENGEFGKTVYEYENLPDLVIDYSIEKVPYKPSPIPSFAYEKNGMLKTQTDYKLVSGVFQKVREVINDNRVTNTRIVFGLDRRPIGLSDPTHCDIDVFLYPSIVSHQKFISKTVEKLFLDDKEVENVTDYIFNHLTHLQMVRTAKTINDREKVITRYKYAEDFPESESNNVVSAMKNERHIHSIPIVQTTSIQRSSGEEVVDVNINEFGFFHNNSLVLPRRIYKMESEKPVPYGSLPVYSPTQLVNALYKTKAEYAYDDRGNIIEIKIPDQVTTTYLWGYEKSHPIAEIKNATFSEVDNALKQSPAILLSDANGNTLNDHDLRVQMDRLRARLPQAFITSLTYNPLVGVTSVTDPSGQTQYYSFDDLGRLKGIMDHDANLTQTYEYKYAH